jgi:MraZ protein
VGNGGERWVKIGVIFRGRFEYTIDPKGRLNIPAPFRDRLRDSDQESFFITNFQDCLYAFAADDWARIEEKLSHVPSTDRKKNSFVRFFIGGAVEAVPDKQGRILIPPSLRSYAALEKDVVILGMPNRFEIWSLARWQLEIGRYEKEVAENPEFAREISDLGI